MIESSHPRPFFPIAWKNSKEAEYKMALSERQIAILERLSDSQQSIPAKSLAHLLGVSSKTIRNDISELNLIFESPLIVSKAGNGYRLIIDKNHLKDIIYSQSNVNLQFEILRFIIDHQAINFYELADKFYISEATLSRMIRSINSVISKNSENLGIIRHKDVISLNGQEEERRQVFNLFLNQEIENYRLSLDKYADYFEYCDIEELSRVIVSFHQENEYILNDFSTISFVLHIAVLIERISIGNWIKLSDFEKIEAANIALANKLAIHLENQFGIKLPTEERAYVARLYTRSQPFAYTEEVDGLDKLVKQLLDDIYNDFYIDFSADSKLTGFLIAHLSNLYKRAKQKQYLTNPLIEELKSKFPFIYNVSVYAAAFIQRELAIAFPDDEIAFIALHFLSASETINLGKKRKILLICPYGIGNERLARMKLKKITDYTIDVIVTTSTFTVQSLLKIHEVDLIITPEAVEGVSRTPVYRYDFLLTDENIHQINTLLVNSPNSVSISESFFKPELFFPQKEFRTKEEVLGFLCEKLTEFQYCDSSYIDKVIEREELSSTAYGNFYAIPHAIQRCAYKNGVAVCSLMNPIDWGDKKVKLVLLLAMKPERDRSLEQLFSQLVKILGEGSYVKKLARQTDFTSFSQMCENL
jgi:lichenan operon transcriptional antiterminator